MGYATLSRWLKGSTQGMFQEQDLGLYQGTGMGSHSLSPDLLTC